MKYEKKPNKSTSHTSNATICLSHPGEGHGLESPPDLSGLTVHVIHRSNATYGHHGEMAHEQMYYI